MWGKLYFYNLEIIFYNKYKNIFLNINDLNVKIYNINIKIVWKIIYYFKIMVKY